MQPACQRQFMSACKSFIFSYLCHIFRGETQLKNPPGGGTGPTNPAISVEVLQARALTQPSGEFFNGLVGRVTPCAPSLLLG